jgi:hypothetical protein
MSGAPSKEKQNNHTNILLVCPTGIFISSLVIMYSRYLVVLCHRYLHFLYVDVLPPGPGGWARCSGVGYRILQPRERPSKKMRRVCSPPPTVVHPDKVWRMRTRRKHILRTILDPFLGWRLRHCPYFIILHPQTPTKEGTYNEKEWN